VPPPPTAPPPAPQPATTPGTGRTPPPPRTQDQSPSVLSTLERLRSQQQQEPPRARPATPPPQQARGGGAPGGQAQLTAGERAAVGERISECWNVDPGMLGLHQIQVTLLAVVDQAGVIREVRPGPDGVPSDPRARSVYEAARRALLNPACSPLPVPRDRLAAVNNFEFRFTPQGFIR
jgi:hypothetical protein